MYTGQSLPATRTQHIVLALPTNLEICFVETFGGDGDGEGNGAQLTFARRSEVALNGPLSPPIAKQIGQHQDLAVRAAAIVIPTHLT